MNVPTVPSEFSSFRLTCLPTRQRNERLSETAGAEDLRFPKAERTHAGGVGREGQNQQRIHECGGEGREASLVARAGEDRYRAQGGAERLV